MRQVSFLRVLRKVERYREKMDIVILGAGTAGLLTALACKKQMPRARVRVFHDPELGIIGVGEGTIASIAEHLHGFLGLEPGEFYRQVRPTWKLGIRHLWGPRSHFNYTFGLQMDWRFDTLGHFNGFYCQEDFSAANISSALMDAGRVFVRQESGDPLIEKTAAYHLENHRFVEYLTNQARERSVEIVEDLLSTVEPGEAGVAALHFEKSGRVTADFYADCSGFRGELIAGAMKEPWVSFADSLFCDRAVVGGWDREPGEPILPYTVSETMSAGWCWQIEHEDRVHRGYVYSSTFVSDETARDALLALAPRIRETRLVNFPSGMRRQSWVGNVVAIGNAAGFVEPLEATAIFVICEASRLFATLLSDHDEKAARPLQQYYNTRSENLWLSIKEFLAVHYRFNTRLETPFWKECRANVNLGEAENIVEFYRAYGPNVSLGGELLRRPDPFGVDGYFTMLLGQAMDWEDQKTIPQREWRTFEEIRQRHRLAAAQALTSEEALERVHSPSWRWRPDFFLQRR